MHEKLAKGGTVVNEAEQRRWNADYWVAVWPRREQLTDRVTETLLDHLQPQPGEHVLDVGCGGGRTTLAVGALVGPGGEAVGYDLSRPLLDLARRRAGEQGSTNTRFVVGDAQQADFTGGPFDAATSQFGVMFFEDPVAAFANIGAHVKAGGRLAFACWQEAERNTWNVGSLLARFAPAPAAPPGPYPTGPFTLADVSRTTALLEAAGWSAIERAPYEITVSVPRDALVDEGQLAFAGIPEAERPAVWGQVQDHLAQFGEDGGLLRVLLAFQVFTARR
jgi:SAM-dependent methyltransferase